MRKEGYQDVFNTIWKEFREDVDNVNNSEEFWKEVLTKYNDMYEKLRGTSCEKFANKMILLCVNELEDIWRRSA